MINPISVELSRSQLGRATELLAAAAFAFEGREVLFPQACTTKGWDLLVRIDEVWKTVQVKTARYFMTGVARSVVLPKTVARLRESQPEIVVLVCPEYGALWKGDMSHVLDRYVKMEASQLWVKGWIPDIQATYASEEDYRKYRGRNYAYYCPVSMNRNKALELVEFFKREPDVGLRTGVWQEVVEYSQGLTWEQLAVKRGITAESTKERILRALTRLDKRMQDVKASA